MPKKVQKTPYKPTKSARGAAEEIKDLQEFLSIREQAAAEAVGRTVLEAAQNKPQFARTLLAELGELSKATKHDIMYFWEGIEAAPKEKEPPPPADAGKPAPPRPAEPGSNADRRTGSPPA